MSSAPPPTPDRAWLREYLAERDEACPSCGYNLRGLTSDVCPECRQRLVLAVRPAEPRIASFVAGLVALSAMAGFHGMLVLWFAWLKWASPSMRNPSLQDLLPTFVCAPVAVAGLWAWVRWRWAFSRRPARVRLGLVVAAWVLLGASGVWFFAWVR